MSESPENCRKSTGKLQEKRPIPGGYYCNQKLDEVVMCHASIVHDLEAITAVNASREEIYRLVVQIYLQVHQSDKIIQELKLIYK